MNLRWFDQFDLEDRYGGKQQGIAGQDRNTYTLHTENATMATAAWRDHSFQLYCIVLILCSVD